MLFFFKTRYIHVIVLQNTQLFLKQRYLQIDVVSYK